jgi:hypothetical protein
LKRSIARAVVNDDDWDVPTSVYESDMACEDGDGDIDEGGMGAV